jgi:hypothetical protein
MSSAEIRTMLGRGSRGALNGLGLVVAWAARAAGCDPTTRISTAQPGGSASVADAGDHAGHSATRATARRTARLTFLDTALVPSPWCEDHDGPRYRL